MKIRIFSEAERRAVASILVNNNYRVEQGKEPRPGKKTMDYFLIAEDVRGENGYAD